VTVRHHYRVNLPIRDAASRPAFPPDSLVRILRHDDAAELAALMLDAYRGSVDDDGETLADALNEVESYFTGKSGAPLLEHSHVCLIDGEIQSAVLISLWQNTPLVAYLMTRAAWKGKGLVQRLLVRSLHSLGDAAFGSAEAFVTEGNIPSERLLASVGFVGAACD
jgi:RimJ/RimL family protein N-acetyltransferase